MSSVSKKLFFVALCWQTIVANAQVEFLYPVGTVLFENSEQIVVLYQQGYHLELWLWNPLTKKAFKGLSHYTPAGLTILPSKTQFSFVDHERIRIKEIFKKSPRSLDLYPLYDFGLVYWIDDSSFYCSARERSHYNLFHITVDGDAYRLTRSSTNDYTYPQKVNNFLFYIKKAEKGNWSIEKTSYPCSELACCQMKLTLLPEKLSAEKIAEMGEDTPHSCLLNSPIETIFTCAEADQAITFLSMHTEKKGFFIKHIHHPFIEKTDKIMHFEYWELSEVEGKWSTRKLFTFMIPLSFLYGKSRLFESILRLLPCHTEKNIVYISATEKGYLNVFCYNTETTTITCLERDSKENSEQYPFTPFFYNGMGLCGGMVKNEHNCLSSGPTMEEANNQGEQVFTFPTVTIPARA